jgi:hypothetical protein
MEVAVIYLKYYHANYTAGLKKTTKHIRIVRFCTEDKTWDTWNKECYYARDHDFSDYVP